MTEDYAPCSKINLVGTIEIGLKRIPLAPHLRGQDTLKSLIKMEGAKGISQFKVVAK